MRGSLSSAEISHVLKHSKNYSFPGVSIKYVVSANPKVGFAIGRSWGSAVERNRFKRIVRVLFFSFFKNPPFFFLLVVPKKAIQLSSLGLELKTVFKQMIKQGSKI